MSNPSNPSIAETFKPEDNLAGCYTLKERLPSQGFCVVWLAHDDELNKDIVLHFVPDSVAADSRAMTELKQEAKRNRQLIHPRIVRVHDLVTDEKWAAISMDHIQGDTLSSLQKKREHNAFNPSGLASSISELCQTLEDAHRIDLFHRDLTPENLILTSGGLMVQKFGFSRVILDSMARSGQLIEGSRDIAYISPQQLDGERPNRGDDLYSLGASLFDLLTGSPPFAEGDIVSQIRKTVPPLVSERRAARGISGEPVPKAWDDTIAACLAKTPEARPKSAAEAATRFASGKAGEAPAAPAAAAAAPSPEPQAPAAVEPPAAAKEAAKAVPSESAPAGKPQKRFWGPAPGKAPVIAEATVLSKTPVSKSEKAEKGESSKEPVKGSAEEPASPKSPEAGPAAEGTAGGAKKGGPTTPSGFPLRAFVEVEGDSKESKPKSSGGLVVAGVVLLFILIIGYLVANNHGSSSNQPAETAAASPSPEASAPAESPAPPAVAEGSASPAPAPVNLAATSPTPAPPEVAPSPTPTIPVAVAVAVATPAAMTDAEVDQAVAAKTKAVDQAKAALADAEKAAKDKAAAQAQAAGALQDLQAAIKQKSDAAAAAKKAADASAAAVKQQQDTLAKAEADAADAQKIAAAKAKAADDIRKAMQDADTAAKQQLTAQQQAQADAAQLAKTAADRQKAADAASKAAADAEAARQQQAQVLAQAQADLGQMQARVDHAQAEEKARKAAEEAARIKKEREATTTRLAAQAAAAAKAAEDAQKALEAAQKAVADAQKAQAEAERQAAAAQNAAPMASPVPSATPAATPPAGANIKPAPSAGGPSLVVHAPGEHMKVDQALINSLGMRFAPVGNVFFCIWLTRVQDFDAFAKATGFKGVEWRQPGFKQGADHPVVNVSWNDANQFCLWLTEKEHREGILSPNETYRLPSDLEWSNAVGLPTETARTPESRDMDVPDVYPWGTQWPPPPGSGNYTGEETDSDVAIKGYNDGFAWTSPVGSFNVNKFGLYDMGGNVWQWCADWWNSDQKAKVLRGGSWYNGALKLSLLSSCRIHASADQGTDNYGFRVVIAQEMTAKKKTAANPATAKAEQDKKHTAAAAKTPKL